MKTNIDHNLEVAKPNFLFFIRNMNPEISQWIQYRGLEIDNNNLFFKFKSSQNSLTFNVYAGVNINNISNILQAKSYDVYQYFKKIKYENIED